MEETKKQEENHGVQATLLAGGIAFVATTAPLLFPKVRKGLSHAVSSVKDIIKKADDPTELKEAAKSELNEELAEKFQDKLKEKIQEKAMEAREKLRKTKNENAEKVHTNAKKVEEKIQNTLLDVRDKLGNAKQHGKTVQEEFQQNTSSSFPGANQIKGASHLKGVASIKGYTKVKGPRSVKHHGDL